LDSHLTASGRGSLPRRARNAARRFVADGTGSGKEDGMILTGEGVLLAVTLAALVVGLVAALALLRVRIRRTGSGPARRDVVKPGTVRRVIVPAGTTPRV
jgi:hypothetical protein